MSIFISKKNIVLFILLLFAVFLFWLSTVNAQGYVPLAPLPGVPAGQETDIGSYLGSIFKIGIGLAGVFAVLMIIISGIQFIGGAASPSAHTEAKERMVNAILGLILALGSWLILNTINPNLLKTNLELAEVTVTGSGPSGFVTQNQNLVQYCVTQQGQQQTCFENLSSCQTAEQNLQSAGKTITQNCPATETNIQTSAGSCGNDGGSCVEGVPGILPGLSCPGNLDRDFGGSDCTNTGYICCR